MSISRNSWVFVTLLVLAFGVWTYEYFTQRTLLALVAIDGESALIFASGRFGPKLQRVDSAGRVQWSTILPAVRETGVRAGLSVAGEVATARVFDDDKVKTWGIDLTTGEVRWKGVDAGIRHPAGLAPAYVSNVGDSDFVYEMEATNPVTAVAVRRESGEELWRTPIPDRYFDVAPAVRAWLRPKVLLVDKPSTLASIDRSTGQLTPIAARRWLCVTDGFIYYEPENDSVLLRRSVDDGTETAWGVLEGHLTGQCAERGTRALLLTERDRVGHIEILDDRGRSSVSLAPWSVDPPDAREWRARYPEAQPMGSAAPRFVPVSVVDWRVDAPGDPAVHGILMIDLDTGNPIWSMTDPRFQHGRWIAAGAVHVFALPGELAVFDSASGQLLAAVRIEGAQPVLPEHVTGDRIWLFGVDELLQLDLKTLAPSRSTRRIRIQANPWPAPSDPGTRAASQAMGQ
jgi:outer membrane protein assembly factor BamB